MNIPLHEYVSLELHGRAFAYISAERAAQVMQENDYTATCHVENGNIGTDWFGQSLPALDNNIYRLWDIEQWRKLQNHLANEHVRIEKAEIMRNTLRDGVRDAMRKLNLPEHQIEQLVRNMSDTVLRDVAKNIGN